MKKLLALILALILALSSAGCTIIRDVKNRIRDLIEIENYKFYGYDRDGNIDYTFDESIIKTIDDRFIQLQEMLDDNSASRADAFTVLFNQQMNDLYYVFDHNNIAFVKFCSDTTDQEASELYEKISKLLNERTAKLYRLYEPIYHSSFAKTFYAGWEEEEIQRALEMSRTSSDEFVKISDEVDSYVQNYDKLDEGESDYLDKSASIYHSILLSNVSLAGESEYDSYPEYAYDNVYGRDFTPSDAKRFYEYVRKYLVPLCKNVLQQLRSGAGLSAIDREKERLQGENVSEAQMTEALTPYYKALGEKNEEAFETFKKNYTSVSNKNGRQIAFTYFLNYYKYPACYFGPDNQSLLTYVHEQGHYLSFYKSGTGINSVDLCEAQSQGNEWLYLSYIKGSYNASDYDRLIKYLLFNNLLSIILATSCDSFEQYLYEHPETSADRYDAVFTEVLDGMGAYDLLSSVMTSKPESYWHRAIVSNSLYYISYAVSLIPVLELYVISQERGFDEAVGIYNKLTVCEYDDGFVEKLTESGLSSPFDEKTIRSIYDYFNK